jgi:tRNA nucleotidyltransferase (CCA-adding enzyme)
VQTTLLPIIRQWAGDMLVGVSPSGSFAKGTANKSGTDIDLFISMSEHTTETLKEIYEKLFGRMQERGLGPTRQNVSVRVKVNGYDVDLVPAKRQQSYGDDHSLYRCKADTWTKTNVTKHISSVINASRQQETRIVKLWRNQKGLYFPFVLP